MPRIHRRPDVDPAAGTKRYGDVAFADPVNRKYPVNTPGRIKAAWAYVHTPSNAANYAAAELRAIKRRIRAAADAREMTLPDPEEHLELLSRVRKRRPAAAKTAARREGARKPAATKAGAKKAAAKKAGAMPGAKAPPVRRSRARTAPRARRTP